MRQRTPYNIVLQAINFYLSGLSLRQTAKELEKTGVERSREAVRKWLKKLGIAARKTEAKEKPRKESATSLPNIQLPKSLKSLAERLYRSLEEAETPSLLALKRPLTARQALSMLNPKHNTSLTHSSWCAFVKGKLSFSEALKAACEMSTSYYVEETARLEREKALRPRKARWGLKKRSFLPKLVPQPSPRDIWPMALKAAATASKLCRWHRKGRVHDPVKLLASLLLKYVPTPKSYRQLAYMLKAEGLSTGLKREAYPSKSTRFHASKTIPLLVLATAITVLYLQLFALYAEKLGRAILNHPVFALDSTYIGFDRFSKHGRLLLRFSILYWPLGGAVACVFNGARRFSKLVWLLPQWAVLTGDSEFWCRSLLLACLARGVTVAIKPKGRGRRPIGLKVDMGWYWARKVCEQVFGHIAKRRRLLLAKTGRGAVVSILLLLAGCNLIALWRGARILELFTRI